jgi:hypothetical protein
VSNEETKHHADQIRLLKSEEGNMKLDLLVAISLDLFSKESNEQKGRRRCLNSVFLRRFYVKILPEKKITKVAAAADKCIRFFVVSCICDNKKASSLFECNRSVAWTRLPWSTEVILSLTFYFPLLLDCKSWIFFFCLPLESIYFFRRIRGD